MVTASKSHFWDWKEPSKPFQVPFTDEIVVHYLQLLIRENRSFNGLFSTIDKSEISDQPLTGLPHSDIIACLLLFSLLWIF